MTGGRAHRIVGGARLEVLVADITTLDVAAVMPLPYQVMSVQLNGKAQQGLEGDRRPHCGTRKPSLRGAKHRSNPATFAPSHVWIASLRSQ
jgi:hypothetical protein